VGDGGRQCFEDDRIPEGQRRGVNDVDVKCNGWNMWNAETIEERIRLKLVEGALWNTLP
jgi:hypothetical protein